MRFASVLQSLSVPALALAAGLTLACAGGAPTAPDADPSFATIRATVLDDTNMSCPRGYQLTPVGFDDPYDLNYNLYVCVYSPGKQLYVDDSGRLGCPNGYQLVQVSYGVWGWEKDYNGNGYICQLSQ
jgi:hypothetical protein